tara:strand:- start:18002 stop:19186 length:1185 start_codon:yes stop_codon:yes gene_type:complete
MIKTDKDFFVAYQPISLNITKAKDDKVFIEGIISSEKTDASGEIIKQDGLDFSYLMSSGYLNYEHRSGVENILGEALKIMPTEKDGVKATAMKGMLYKKKKIVKDILETINAMKDAGSNRKLGFSVEGRVEARDPRNPSIITKAKVLNVSVTANPCNTDADFEIVKKNILIKEEEMKKEYDDLGMSYRQSKMLEDYSMKLCALLGSLPQDADLPEWVQAKITKALDYLQASYHYLCVEMQEMEMGYDYKRKEKYYDMDKAPIKYEDKSPEAVAAKLLEVHPELMDEKVMEAIHQMMMDKKLPEMEDELKPEHKRELSGDIEHDIAPHEGAQAIEDVRIEMDKNEEIRVESLEDEVSSEDYDDAKVRDLVQEILSKYPEIKDEKIMALVHQLMDK